MQIRRFRESDEEEKRELHLKTIKQVNSEDYSEKQIDAWTTFEEDSSFSEEKILRWVAEENGEIVGFADYVPEKSKITGVYVHPAHLRKGVGSKLLKKILEDAKKRGLSELRCESSVTARQFYQSHGFKVTKETVHETNGVELDAFEMKKSL